MLYLQNLDQLAIHVGLTSDVKGRVMPDKKEQDMWWAYLAEKPESEWNPPREAKKKN
jgi:hypothetical protein